MANAPSTSSYVLLASEPIDLPNGQVLTATPGLEIQSGGASGNVLISPSLGLDSIVQLNSSGIAVYNALTTTFTTTSLQTDGTLYINNQDGLDGPPTLGVLAQRTVQLVKGSANGGSSVGAYPELHFTGSGAASCSVTADAGNNRLVVNYGVAVGATGEGTVTSVGLESSGSTLTIGGTNPVTSSGVIDVNLPAFGVAGTYMNPQITLDDYGRVIGATSGSGGNGTVTSVGITSTNSSLTVSGSPVTTSGNINVQMPATGVAAGTYSFPTISVDGFGRITSATNGTPVTSVAMTSSNGSLTVSGSPITSSGTLNVQMPATGVAAGTYTNSTLTVDSYGRLTSASNGSAIGTITGTVNQITASTLSGNTTLSIPSDFRVPGTLAFPNTTQASNSSNLSYYTNSITTYPIKFGSSGAVYNLNISYERVGNLIFVSTNDDGNFLTCDVASTSLNANNSSSVPAAYIPTNIGSKTIGYGTIIASNSSNIYLYTLTCSVVLSSNGSQNGTSFQFVLDPIVTFDGTTYTSNQPTFVVGNIYRFGSVNNINKYPGINFFYSRVAP